MLRRFAPHVCAAFLLMAPAAYAQNDDQAVLAAADPPAHVSLVDGAAVLERDGQPDAAPTNMPLLAGDRIRTLDGRVEILFADGSTLHMDTRTTVDFQSDELVRLLDGRVRLTIPGPHRSVSYRVDAPSAWVQINQPGDYRVALSGDEVELAVLRGAAELVNDSGRTALVAGERAFSRANAAPSYAYVVNSASWDAFDRWSETRRDQRLGVSTQYLPDQVRPYAPAFDQYGVWRHDASYGNVWYPNVSIDWRPYYYGRWVSLRPYGWTWVGTDPWAWATHHYGRWGFSAGAWFWIPGRSWAPAWVSWAYAPGYVSWCPLGWNNRPVVQVNLYGRGYDPWRAWTVLPQRHFGTGFVNVRGLSAGRIDLRTRGSFVTRNAGPHITGYAVPRGSTPIRVAGTARPRPGSSPVYTNLQPGASRVGAAPSRTIVGPSRSTLAPEVPGRAPYNTGGRQRAVPRSAEQPQAPRLSSPAMPDRRASAPDSFPRNAAQPSYGTDSRVAPRTDQRNAAGRQFGAGDRTPPQRAVPRAPGAYRPPAAPSYQVQPPVQRAQPSRPPAAPMYPSRVAPPAPRTEAPRAESPADRSNAGERRAPGPGRGPAGGMRAAPPSAPPSAAPPPQRQGGNVDRRAPAPNSSAPARTGTARPRGGRGGR